MAEKEPEKKDKPVSKKHSAADVLTKEEPDAKKKAEAKESEKKPAAKKEAKAKKMPKHTHIEHHGNGSHTVRHTQEDGSENSYAAPDTNSMISNLQQNLGQGGGAPEDAGAGAPPPEAAPVQAAPQGGM